LEGYGLFEKFRKNKKSNSEETNLEDIQDDLKIDDLIIEAENMDEVAIQKHEKHYSNDGLWNKVQKFSKKAGSTVVYAVLILYFTMQKPDVPLKVKATILGALGYFILPIDLVPDVAIGLGYTDDLAVITIALLQVSMYIDGDVKKQAKDKLKVWFGEDVDTSGLDDKLDGTQLE